MPHVRFTRRGDGMQHAVDGEVYLRALCKPCHVSLTANPCYVYPVEQRVRITAMNAFKRELRVCDDPACGQPEELCIEGSESSFHLDHVHVKNCACGLESCDPGV